MLAGWLRFFLAGWRLWLARPLRGSSAETTPAGEREIATSFAQESAENRLQLVNE